MKTKPGKRIKPTKKTAVKPKGKGRKRLVRKFKSRKPKRLIRKPSLSVSPAIKVVPQFPGIPQAEFENLLPCYHSVLSRSEQEGITMLELNQLQSDIEQLLSKCAARQYTLFKETESLKRRVNREKKGKFCFKKEVPVQVKRRRLEPKIKVKEPNVKIKVKNKAFLEESKKHARKKHHVIPKVSMPKNDTSEKFWLSVEPFCSTVTKDDAVFLDDLIKECASEKLTFECIEGDHYSKAWTEESLTREQNQSCPQRTVKVKPNGQSKIEKQDFNKMIDTFTSPLSEKLLGALVENNLTDAETKSKETPKEAVKRFSNPDNRICMENRLQDELFCERVFTILDMTKERLFKVNPISFELHKSTLELKAISEQNVIELTKLRKVVDHDLKKQDVKDELNKVDVEIRAVYSKLISLNQSKSTVTPDADLKDIVQDMQKTEEEARMLLQKQVELERRLEDLE